MATTPFTIPAQTINSPLVIDGTTVELQITIPAQTVQLPASGGGSTTLPSGLTWANGVFTVAGSISATQVNLTGGSALPPSSSGLYVLQLANGALQPVALPPVTAASTTPNNVTLTP